MATDLNTTSEEVGVGEYQDGFHDPTDEYVFVSRKGLGMAGFGSLLGAAGGTVVPAAAASPSQGEC